MADESNPSATRPNADDRDITTLTGAGITVDEVRRLRGAGVVTVAQLRERVTCEGLGDLERQTRIEGYRLVELLPTQFAVELADEILYRAEMGGLVPPDPTRAKQRRLPLGVRAWRASARGAAWLREHLLDFAVIGGVALVALLLLRAFGYLGRLPPPWGLDKSYAVAARDLKKGQTLYASQLDFARLPPAEDYFAVADGLEGLKLARDVPRLKPLHREDLLRLQVLAARDIAQGETFTAADLKMEWRPLQPKALLRVSEVENAKARLAVPKDDVITTDHLAR